MAKYSFKCVNKECEKCETEFTAHLAMADVGKLDLYPRCECCGELTEKVFAPNGVFKLKGGNWFKSGGYGGYSHDMRGNSLEGSMQIGSAWGDRE